MLQLCQYYCFTQSSLHFLMRFYFFIYLSIPAFASGEWANFGLRLKHCSDETAKKVTLQRVDSNYDSQCKRNGLRIWGHISLWFQVVNWFVFTFFFFILFQNIHNEHSYTYTDDYSSYIYKLVVAIAKCQRGSQYNTLFVNLYQSAIFGTQ